MKRSSRTADPKPRAASRWPFRRREQETAVAELMVAEVVSEEAVGAESGTSGSLERMARAQAGDHARDQEWAALFMHLREFANADGVLPAQFDDLVRESFPG